MAILLGLQSQQSLMTGRKHLHAFMRYKDYRDVAKHLRKMISLYRANQAVRERAVAIIRDEAEPKNKREQAIAVAEWVQRSIYYVHERPERFQTPVYTLAQKAGDCDDFTTLICAMLESIGIVSRFVIMGWDGGWQHIFPQAVILRPRKAPLVLNLDATLDDPVSELTDPVALKQAQGKRVQIIAG